MIVHANLRDIPSVDRMLSMPEVAKLIELNGRAVVADQVRAVLADERNSRIAGESAAAPAALVARLERSVERSQQLNLRPVINGTGVIIHTNLGRATLSDDAAAAAMNAATSYSNLEFDLDEGNRGSRHSHVRSWLAELTGAEDALVANNNAGAVLLALASLATCREIVVSRSQAIEIGGGFRIPEVMEQSGGQLVEVGTTNRTYLADYERAVGPDTAVFLRVHQSNFRIIGFTHEPPLEELVELAGRHGLSVVDDLGSGCLIDPEQFGLRDEPIVRDSVEAGADLVCFSGDKLLGGPQAGLIVGRSDAVQRCASHPLARALRIDKMSLAALEATLRHYQRGEATEKIPVWRMISASTTELESRGQCWLDNLAPLPAEVGLIHSSATVGGGSTPAQELESWAVHIGRAGRGDGLDCDIIARALRTAEPPVIGRIEHDRVLIDLRTILPNDDVRAMGSVYRALSTILE